MQNVTELRRFPTSFETEPGLLLIVVLYGEIQAGEKIWLPVTTTILCLFTSEGRR